MAGLLFAAGGVFAQFAQRTGAQEEETPEFPPFERFDCPTSQTLRASSWRGQLPARPTVKQQELCGKEGHWTYFRARPSAGDLELWWQSDGPVHVAVGWGSCHAQPVFCPSQDRQVIRDWPLGAELWVAVSDPSARLAPTSEDSGDTSKDSAEKDTGPEPAGLGLRLGWRGLQARP